MITDSHEFAAKDFDHVKKRPDDLSQIRVMGRQWRRVILACESWMMTSGLSNPTSNPKRSFRIGNSLNCELQKAQKTGSSDDFEMHMVAIWYLAMCSWYASML